MSVKGVPTPHEDVFFTSNHVDESILVFYIGIFKMFFIYSIHMQLLEMRSIKPHKSSNFVPKSSLIGYSCVQVPGSLSRFTQVLSEVRHRNMGIYSRLRALCRVETGRPRMGTNWWPVTSHSMILWHVWNLNWQIFWGMNWPNWGDQPMGEFLNRYSGFIFSWRCWRELETSSSKSLLCKFSFDSEQKRLKPNLHDR